VTIPSHPPLTLHPDRLFSPEPIQRDIARELHAEIAELPLLCPHGHTDPRWFADNEPFENAADLLITPDHYLVRMLYSQGVPLEALGIAPRNVDAAGGPGEVVASPRDVWRTFAEHFHLFRGTPSGFWMNHVLSDVFGIDTRLTRETADASYDRIAECLTDHAFRPRALLDRFGIEVVATTDGALSDLAHHQRLAAEGFAGRVIPTFRPDSVVDPDHEVYADHVQRLGEITGRDTTRWDDYLAALFDRRKLAISLGATATDHGHPSAYTASVDAATAQRLLDGALAGTLDASGKETLRGQVLVEMAAMSIEDGLVMQLHPGSHRNHNRPLYERFGRDIGADIPGPIDYVDGLRALLNRFGNDVQGIFTPNESSTTGMLLALQDMKLAGKVVFVGFDSSPSFIAAMRSKQMNGTVLQSPFNMGYLGVKTMVDQLLGKSVEKRIDTGVVLVTPDNLDDPKIKELLQPPVK